MFGKNLVLAVLLVMAVGFYSQITLAGVTSCVECNGLMDGPCLAKKYLPFDLFSTDQNSEKFKKEWSASQGTFFAKENVIGVRFQLDDQSLQTLKMGGFGLEIEIVEKNSHQLKWNSYDHTLPDNARATGDSKALDQGNDTVHAIVIRNPENLKAGVDYYVWFFFNSIPDSGILIQPNIAIDIHTDCSLAKPFCTDVEDREVCEYFEMETDSYTQFPAYPDGRKGK